MKQNESGRTSAIAKAERDYALTQAYVNEQRVIGIQNGLMGIDDISDPEAKAVVRQMLQRRCPQPFGT